MPLLHQPSTSSTLPLTPPTRAHLHIATSALTQDCGLRPKRLLLLLATQNADKAPKPASFEQRLVLMTIFANDLLKSYRSSVSATKRPASNTSKDEEQQTAHEGPAIDIAVTKHPYFIDKASAIAKSGLYPPSTVQVHLTGYDTLVRILDPKYYPPTHTLAPLEPFLSKHRLRVTYRTEADWGDRQAQKQYLEALGEGKMENEGGKREWRGKIELVEGRKEGDEVVSSTRVREAASKHDTQMLGKMVTEGVKDWVLEKKLYMDE